jgi:putative peptidoglycan lipid II flippase
MAIISIIANIVFGILLMVPMDHGGLALALSLASMVNLGLLVRALQVRLGSLGWKSIAESAWRTMTCSAAMGAAVWAVALFIIPSEYGTISSLFFGLTGSIVIGLVLFGAFSFLTKSPELDEVLVIVREGLKR